MNLNRIRLELARTPEFPDGSSRHGYEFVAPLTKDARIDPSSWNEKKDRCKVIRFWGGEKRELGILRHIGKSWRFDYDASDDADDEVLFKLDHHVLVPGAYVSVTEHDGVQRPFRVVSVTRLAA